MPDIFESSLEEPPKKKRNSCAPSEEPSKPEKKPTKKLKLFSKAGQGKAYTSLCSSTT